MQIKSGTDILIKLVNEADTAETVDFQTAILEHVENVAPDLSAPRVVRDKNDRRYCKFKAANGKSYLMRAMTLLGGTAISDREFDGVDLIALGDLVARVDGALSSFHHPAQRPVLIWDVMIAERLRTNTASIKHLDLRISVEAAFDRLCKTAFGPLRTTAHQLIHYDINGDKVLVDGDNRIAGIVDFGDAVFAPRLIEVCVTASQIAEAYPNDALAKMCQVIGGYAARSQIADAQVPLILPTMLG